MNLTQAEAERLARGKFGPQAYALERPFGPPEVRFAIIRPSRILGVKHLVRSVMGKGASWEAAIADAGIEYPPSPTMPAAA